MNIFIESYWLDLLTNTISESDYIYNQNLMINQTYLWILV